METGVPGGTRPAPRGRLQARGSQSLRYHNNNNNNIIIVIVIVIVISIVLCDD